MKRLALAVAIAMSTLTLTVPASASTPTTDEIKAYAKSYVLQRVLISIKQDDGPRQWKCFKRVIHYESRWDHRAENGIYYGLGQIGNSKARHNGKPYKQVRDTWKYMVHRYKDRACGAWNHIKWIGWY
jgi:hypothetical protein